MRISLLSFLGDGGGRPVVDAYVEELRQAKQDGFDHVWTPQLPWEPDLLVTLGVALREVDGITVGTGVLPIQVRHPMVMAQEALTVSLISGGRLRLGLGLTHAMVTEGMWNIPWDRNIRRMNDYLDGLLPLLEGRPADATGQLTTTRGFVTIPGAPPPPVYLAALGPQLLGVAGRRTAGTLTWMTGPRTLADHIVPTINAAAAAAGRRAEVVAGLPICVTDDTAAALRLARETFAMYGTLPSYRAMLDREGLAEAGDVAIVGDEATVEARLHEVAAAGVTELAAAILAPDPEAVSRTRALLRRLG